MEKNSDVEWFDHLLVSFLRSCDNQEVVGGHLIEVIRSTIPIVGGMREVEVSC